MILSVFSDDLTNVSLCRVFVLPNYHPELVFLDVFFKSCSNCFGKLGSLFSVDLLQAAPFGMNLYVIISI